jgi:hypothetical protein
MHRNGNHGYDRLVRSFALTVADTPVTIEVP